MMGIKCIYQQTLTNLNTSISKTQYNNKLFSFSSWEHMHHKLCFLLSLSYEYYGTYKNNKKQNKRLVPLFKIYKILQEHCKITAQKYNFIEILKRFHSFK